MDMKKKDRKRRAADNVGGNKKSRKSVPTNVALVDDVFSIILPMLTPKDMLRLVCTCKTFANMLTYEMVVRNAVLHGGHARKTMYAMSNLLQHQSIVIPSPLRLLRLANGRRCEAFHCSKRVLSIRPVYGVFLCHSCLKERLHKTFVNMVRQGDLEEALKHPRVTAKICYSEATVWKEPFLAADGEICGPLVSMKGVATALNEKMNMPTYLASIGAPSHEQYNYLRDAIMIAKADAVIRDKEVLALTEQKRYDRSMVRIDKVFAVVERIKASFADKPWKFCFEMNVVDDEEHRSPQARFECGIMEESFKHILESPSRISKKEMGEISSELDRQFSVLYQSGFVDFSFLSDDRISEPFQAYLRQYCTEKFTPRELLLTTRVNKALVERIERGDTLRALAIVLGCNAQPSPCVFSSAVMAAQRINPAMMNSEIGAKLANHVWRHTSGVNTPCLCQEIDKVEHFLHIGESKHTNCLQPLHQLLTDDRAAIQQHPKASFMCFCTRIASRVADVIWNNESLSEFYNESPIEVIEGKI